MRFSLPKPTALALAAAIAFLPTALHARVVVGNQTYQDGVKYTDVPTGYRPFTLNELEAQKRECAQTTNNDEKTKCEWMTQAAINAVKEAQRTKKSSQMTLLTPEGSN